MSRGPKLSSPTVGIDWLRDRMDDPGVRIIDARRQEDYKKGHIKGAHSLPLSLLLKDESPEKAASLLGKAGVDEDMVVVVYDDYRATHAARLAWTFEFIGQQNVAILETNFDEWAKKGLEVSFDEPTVEPKERVPKINPELMATVDYIKDRLGQPSPFLIDSRERLNFLDGHIPGARSMPWWIFGEGSKAFLSPERLARIIKEQGIGDEDEVITYCGSAGTISSVAFYAFKLAGFKRIKLYVKSLAEWKSLGLPLEKVKEAQFWDLMA